MKNNKITFIKIKVNAIEEIVRSSLSSDNLPANADMNNTARGVASKNNPVKRVSYPKPYCK